MNRVALTVLSIIAAVSQTDAKIGDPPEAYVSRYGNPIRESIDRDGSSLRLYHSTEFEQVRVTFVKNRSQAEQYKVAADSLIPDSMVETVRRENPGQSINPGSTSITVGTDEEFSELKFVTHSEKKRSYVGTVDYREQDRGRMLAFRGVAVPWLGEWLLPMLPTKLEVVIEIPLYRPDSGLEALKPNTKYKIRVLDALSEDINTEVAIVSRREHIDWNDAVNDAHSSFQQLLSISTDQQVLFDRSVCGRHHVKMEKRDVEVAYGMLAYSKAESYCIDHYPNFRNYAAGGCVMTDDSPKSTAIYICPKCVAECNEYKRQHPEENKSPFD